MGIGLVCIPNFLRQELDPFNELMDGALIESVQRSFTMLVLCPSGGILNQIFGLTRLPLAICDNHKATSQRKEHTFRVIEF